jgi:hypothetical protein
MHWLPPALLSRNIQIREAKLPLLMSDGRNYHPGLRADIHMQMVARFFECTALKLSRWFVWA